MSCFNPKGRPHLTLKCGLFGCAVDGSQRFMILKLFSCFPTGVKNGAADTKNWDVSKMLDQFSL